MNFLISQECLNLFLKIIIDKFKSIKNIIIVNADTLLENPELYIKQKTDDILYRKL